MSTIGIVSFRLGGGDGVSIEAAKWTRSFEMLGHRVRTVAGSGADVVVPGLGLPDQTSGCLPDPPSVAEVSDALAHCDVVVVENLLSLPLNPPAASVVAQVLRGRPAILHHHDLPWQRRHLAHHPPPPDDRAWGHVTINELSRRQLGQRGIEAVTIYNHFDCHPQAGDRRGLRRALRLPDSEILVLQPTRALARKNVGAAVALTEEIGGTYWLLGSAEDGYGPELERLLAAARCPVVRGMPSRHQNGPFTMDDAYAACDVVALPSSWEGFGNPTVESAVHRRPLCVGRYPVAAELAAFGFEWFWFDGDTPPAEALTAFLARPVDHLLSGNLSVAKRHFDLAVLPDRLRELISGAGPRTWLSAPSGLGAPTGAATGAPRSARC